MTVPLLCPLTSSIITEPWRTKYGRVFQKSKQLQDFVEKHGQCPIDDRPMTLDDFEAIPEDKIPQRVFIWKQQDSVELTEGFVAIKEFIFLSCRLKLFLLRSLLQSRFGKDCVVGAQTDCLLLNANLKMIEISTKEHKTQPQKPQNQADIRQWIGEGAQPPLKDDLQKPTKKTTTKSATIEDVKELLTSNGYVFGHFPGQLRIEKKPLPIEFERVPFIEKALPVIFQQSPERTFEDEMNIPPEDVAPNTQILGMYPGVGKTTLAAKLFPDKKHIFATPFNRLSQELRRDYGCEAYTVHKLIGKRMTDDGTEKMKKDPAMRFPDGSVVVFDEIYLNSVKMLADIWQYMKRNPKLIFVATGDVYQLPPIEQSLNNLGGPDDDPKMTKAYYKRVIARMFPSSILLTQIKRLTDEEQKKRIHRLKFELFDASPLRSVEELLRDLFPASAFVNHTEISRRSICYFSKKSIPNSVKQINEAQQMGVVVERLQAGLPVERITRYAKKKDGGREKIFFLWDGMTIICRKTFYAEKDKCFTNFLYTVHHIDGKYVYFFDAAEIQTVMKIERSQIHKHFQYNFAGTCHSYQGLSLVPGFKTTVLHANHAMSSREWLYVAITRARDLNDLQFVLLSQHEVKESKDMISYLYWSRKIEGYKRQDKLAGRPIEETDTNKYVNVKWFLKRLGTQCKCGKLFEAVRCQETATVKSNLTANRNDNRFAHFQSNIYALCLSCNVALSNRPSRYHRWYVYSKPL